MSTTSTTSSVSESFPIAEIGDLSIRDDTQSTPTPKDKKSLSESSLRTMTPPDSTRGAPLTANGFGKTNINPEAAMFVRSQHDDDVFGRRSNASPNPAMKAQSTNAENVAMVKANLPTATVFKQAPRLDRMYSPITPANAQGLLPPEACIFVANLTTIRTDDQLEISCYNHFSVFGECFVKIRRDKHRHPFALVQYYTVEEANDAMRGSQDIEIDGRVIRVEHAQARRSVVLTKVGGGAVTEDEVREVLSNLGPVSRMHPTTNHDARELGLPEGMWVEFSYYLDFKDAVKSFNNEDSLYRIHVPPEVEPRTRMGPSGSPVVKGFQNPRSSTDQKSIFVGNLPAQTNENTLTSVFEPYGIIKAVNVIRKPIQGGEGVNTFGFVEFSTISEAEAAADSEIEIHGMKVRVEPKEYSARRHTRLQYSSPAHNLGFWRGPRQVSPYYPTQSISLPFDPVFYGISSPPHAQIGAGTGGMSAFDNMHHLTRMSPFHAAAGHTHHQGNGYPPMSSGVYATPPSGNRMPRRRNNESMYTTGSPHAYQQAHHQGLNMAHYSQFTPGPNSGYSGHNMGQIPEEQEGHGY